MEFGDAAEVQAAGQFMAEIVPRMVEGCQRLMLLAFIAAQRNLHVRMADVRADMHLRDIDRNHAGIVEFEGDQFGKLLTDRFGDALCSMFIHIEWRRL